jgi:OOP family OmpA-OmpF porin
LAGIAWRGRARIDAAAGRGWSGGYGTTAFRGVIAGSIGIGGRSDDDRPVPLALEEVVDLPDVAPAAPPPVEPSPPVAPPPVAPPPDPLPIRFAQGRAELSATALDQLRQLAVAEGGWIIEGHASEEGTLNDNYALATARARAVYEALVVAGLSPARLSYRAVGEVRPSGDGRSADRRVELRWIPIPGEPPSVPIPWTGPPPEAR